MKAITIETVFKTLQEDGNKLTPADIRERNGLSQSAVYGAIKELKAMGVVREERIGRVSKFFAVASLPENFDTALQETNSGATVNFGNLPKVNTGINTMEYDMDKFSVPPEEDYINRKFSGIKDFDLFDRIKEHNKNGAREIMNLLMIGDTGSGKTKSIRAWCGKRGYNYGRANLDGSVTFEDLVGTWVRSGNDWYWVDGLIPMFMREGGVLVIDEINSAPPEILFILNQVLDSDRQIILRNKDNEMIKAHPDFVIVACMNPNYYGTRPLNKALKDRFNPILTVGYDDNVEKKIIGDDGILEFAKHVRHMFTLREIGSSISTRTLIQFQENIDVFGYKFSKETLLNKFDDKDRSAIWEALDMMLNKRNDDDTDADVEDGLGALFG